MTRDTNPRIADPSRRRSLQAMVAPASAAGINPRIGLGAADQSAQRTRTIPNSGETVPVMGLGTARTFDVAPTPDNLDPLREVVRLFIDRGGRMIDSSPMYGRAEGVVGRHENGRLFGEVKGMELPD